MHFILSVTVFSTRVIIFIGDTIFTSPTGDGTDILCGHPSQAKVLSIGLAPGNLTPDLPLFS